MTTGRARRDTVGLVVLMGLGATALVAVVALDPAGDGYLVAMGGSQSLFAVLGLIFAIRAARLPGLPPRIRRAWRMLLVPYVLWPVSIVLFLLFPDADFPDPPSLALMLIGITTLAGILAFARLPAASAERAKLRLEAGVVGAGTAMVLWYLVVSPALSAGNSTWHELVPAISFPVINAGLIFAVSVVMLRGPDAAAARIPLMAVVGAAVFRLVGDTIWSYTLIRDPDATTTPLQALLYTAAILLHMLAPYLQIWCHRRPPLNRAGAGAGRSDRPPRWPYLTIIPGYALLMLTVGVEQPFPAGGLIAGAFIVSILIVGRQMLAAQESRRMAVTDALTGLANRVRLYDELPRALARADRNGTRVGVLVLDMNGFKQVNDRFGHRAGDELLIGFAALLRRNVLGADLVARQGGDEFAIVLPGLTGIDQAETVAGRIRAAMAEPIDIGAATVQPSAGIGVALSEPGELTADDLLHRADLAMYGTKPRRSTEAAHG